MFSKLVNKAVATMATELVHVGFGDYLAANRILTVIKPGSVPVRRLLEAAERRNLLVDITHGRRTKSVVLLDSGHLVLLALQPETIASRLKSLHSKDGEDA